MPPPNPEPKKLKLSLAERTATQTAIDKLAVLDFTFSPVPQTLASELISSLNLGLGLLGTPEEEEEYYQSYVQSKSSDTDDQVSLAPCALERYNND
jgi:hypothetical protein